MANKTANEALYDATIRHQIKLLRYSEGQAKSVARILQEADDQLETLLKADLTEATEARLRALLVDVRKQRQALAERLQQELEKDSQELAENEAEWEMEAIKASAPVELKLNAIAPATMKALTKKPINGVPLEGWLGQMTSGDVTRIEQQIRLGMTQGETLDQLVRRIRGSKANNYTDGVTSITRRNAQTIARTAVNHVSNSARQEVWNANADIISGVRWVATLDGRTSDVCRGRDGMVYKIDEGPRPPGHPGCRSTTVPVLDGERIVGDRPFVRDTRTRAAREVDFRAEAKAAAGSSWKDMTKDQRQDAIRAQRKKWTDENVGQVQSSQTYDSWLRGQPKEFQNEVLGKGKADLFRGGMTLDKFVDEKGEPYTLAQLKAATSQDKLHVVQPGVGMKAKALLQQGMSTDEVLAQIKQEYPDANTTPASIASYKSELKKAGALDQLVGKVPQGGIKQALAVSDVLSHMEAGLPEGLKHHVGGQWANVVEDLDGAPGAYGYYQAGKGVQLSGKKLSAISQQQAQQVIAHELGHLLHKQHDVVLDPDWQAAMAEAKDYHTPDGKKLYAYYLSHKDELTAEIYAQALSPSPLTSQGLSALEFNSVYKAEIDEAKKLFAEKFPKMPDTVPPPLKGAPTEVGEVAGKHTTVGGLAKALLQQGVPDSQVLQAVLAEFPTAKTTKASLASYKVELKKKGLLPEKGSGPTVVAKAVPDVSPVPPSPAMQEVVQEQAAAGVQLPQPYLYGKPLTETQEDVLDSLLSSFEDAVKESKGKLVNPLDSKLVVDQAKELMEAVGMEPSEMPDILELAAYKTMEKNAIKGAAKAVKAAPKAPKPEKVKLPALLGKELSTADQSVVDWLQNKYEGFMKEPGWDNPATQMEAKQLLLDSNMLKYQTAKTKVPKWMELAEYKAAQKLGKAPSSTPMPTVAAPSLPPPKLAGAQLGSVSTQALEKVKTLLANGGDVAGAHKLLGQIFGTTYKEAAGGDLIELAKYEIATGKAAAKPYLAAQVKNTAAMSPEYEAKYAQELAKKEAEKKADEEFLKTLIPARQAMTPREGIPPPPRFTTQQRLAAVRMYNKGHWSREKKYLDEVIAQGGGPDLTEDEKLAIINYTGNTYTVLNNGLRRGEYKTKQQLAAFVEAAQSGLAKLPKYQGPTSRGITYASPELQKFIEETYRPGAIVEEHAFVSTSKGAVAAFNGPVYMKITSKTGVWVDPFSAHKGENEVLFMPGTRFKVLKVEVLNGKKIITMEEV